MYKIRAPLFAGISAGLMVGIGCGVFVSCENKVVGAVLFAVALLAVCFCGLNLYTGKIGFMAYSHTKQEFITLFLGLVTNIVAIVGFCLLMSFAVPSMEISAKTIAVAKLGQPWIATLIRGFFCGILMFLAVYIWRNSKNTLGILFAIPVFILSGYEHSIADAGYLAMAHADLWESVIYVLIVAVGNTLGSLTVAVLFGLSKEKED